MKKNILISFCLIFLLVFSVFCTPILASEAPQEAPEATQPESSDSVPEDSADSGEQEGTSEDSEDSEDPENSEDSENLEDPEQSEQSNNEPQTFSVAAKAALLLELNSDSIAYELNIHEKIYPASLTKVMTCLVALELCQDLNEPVTVTQQALEGLDPDGVTVSLQPGEIIPMSELLYCMMVPSANDACTVVAEHLCGSVDAFVEKMNEKAAELGCTGTHFANPDGLHDDDHYTTVWDLSIITKAALQNELFRDMTSTTVHDVPATNLSDARRLYTTNYLLSTDINPDYYYEKATGIKTGFTSQAGRCLISTAQEGDFYYLSIVVGCDTTMNEDGSVVYESFVQTKKLLEYGLDHFDFVTVLSKLVPTAQVPVTKASASSVVIAPSEDVTALLPTEYLKDRITTNYELVSDTLEAPLQEQDEVGTIYIYYDGKKIGETSLHPITDVEKHEIKYLAKTAEKQIKTHIWPILVAVIVLILFFVVLKISHSRKNKNQKKKAPSWDKE